MKIEMTYYEVQELACAICGLDYDTLVDEGREDEIEDALYEKFGISIEQFSAVAEALLPFTPVVEAGISGTLYHAFVNDKEGVMIAKRKKE